MDFFLVESPSPEGLALRCVECAWSGSARIVEPADVAAIIAHDGACKCPACGRQSLGVGQRGTVDGVRATITSINTDGSIDVRVPQGEWRVESAEFTSLK